MERQKHGFLFEDHIIQKYNLIKSDNYSSKFDAYYNNVPCSIKCIKLGSEITLGDVYRNSDNSQEFYMFIGFWQGIKTHIVEEYILKITPDKWKTYFDLEILSQIENDIKDITNNHIDDKKWKDVIKKYRDTYNNIYPIKLRFKRDHKKQKRVQCAINFNDFKNIFIKEFTNEDFK